MIFSEILLQEVLSEVFSSGSLHEIVTQDHVVEAEEADHKEDPTVIVVDYIDVPKLGLRVGEGGQGRNQVDGF